VARSHGESNGDVPRRRFRRRWRHQKIPKLIERVCCMAGIYRTFMVDPLGALAPTLGNAIQSQLAGLFSPVVGFDRFFENNWVFFNPTGAAPMIHELLVYFMPAGQSIVKYAPHTGTIDLSVGGNTAFGAGASEVYVKGDDPVFLAKMAFHELMHNRLKLGDSQLHPQGGVAAERINAGTLLNDRNIKSMAAVLRVPITQFTAGIATLKRGKNDPMSEYYAP
jgi:hypothetical protein